MKILVTGGSGFVGGHLLPMLVANGHQPILLSRTLESSGLNESLPWRLLDEGRLAPHLREAEAVVHLAGIAHRTAEPGEHDSVNRQVSERLAMACSAAGVGRFVFVSSATVYGESPRGTVGASTRAMPIGPYARSKLNAEHAIGRTAAQSGMSVVSLRPPVIYGAGVKGNLATLASFVRKGRPIPVSVDAETVMRSLLSVNGLCTAVLAAVESKAGLHGAFPIADREPTSVLELVERVGDAVGEKPRVVRFPGTAMRFADRGAAYLVGRKLLAPLYTGFEIDSSAFGAATGWVESLRQSDFDRACSAQ